MYGYIYLITNKVNNKKYIGQRTADFYTDTTYLGSGTLIKKSVAKYGAKNFEKELLEECNSKEELDIKEKEWISKYNAVEDIEFYNLANGANGSAKGSKRSEETKKKLSDRSKQRTLDEETRIKISKTVSSQVWVNNGQIETKATNETLDEFVSKGFVQGRLKFSKDHLQHMSETRKGRRLPEKAKNILKEKFSGTGNPFYGKTHSDESRKKMSERAKQRVVSEETKLKLTKQRTGRKWINNGTENKFVRPETLQDYLQKGWKLGIIH